MFRDYYDGATAYGGDPSRIFPRRTETDRRSGHAWPFAKEPFERLHAIFGRGVLHGVGWPGWLFFCGRAWPVYAPVEGGEWPVSPPVDATGHVLLGEIVARYERTPEGPPSPRGAPKEPWTETFFGRGRLGANSSTGPSTASILESAEARLAGVPLGADTLIGLRVPYAIVVPLFAGHRRSTLQEILLVTNPPLFDLGFHRILDSYGCYQAIETFLGNELAPPDLAPDRVGSDEILARQKGFDAMSFRTAAPGNKKANRARNRARKKGP